MTKRLVDIDDELLGQAQTLLGAKTMKDTVNQALEQLVNGELRRQHLVRLETGEGLDLADDAVMSRAWR